MRRKWIAFLGAVCMIMVMVLPVQAAESKGSIRIIPVWSGRKIPGGEISLSRVGDKTPEGYRITDGLADWIVSEEEIFSGEWTQWLKEQSNAAIIRSAEQGSGAFFDGLAEGLYLVQQKKAAPEFLAFRPFLLSVPEGNQWRVVQEVQMIHDEESPQTGDRHVPLIGAMGLGFSAAMLMVLLDQRKK